MRNKQEKGITLLTLVITIIVMLILVGVSVNIAINSDLIGVTEDTVTKWNEATDKEKEDIDKLLGELGNIAQDQCNHQYGEWEIVKEATCTEEGSKTSTCTKCNQETTEVIEKTSHTYETGVCTICGHELEIPKGDDAITFGDVIWSTGIAGITVSTETEYKIQYQINNIDGQWVEIANNTMVTGLANGDTVYARLWNGTAAGEHTSADIICTHNYENGTCTICGVTCEHTYGSWTTVKEATCTETGTRQRVCSTCNNRDTQIIEATSHTYEIGVCTKCGHELAIPEGDEAISFGDVEWNSGVAQITVSTETEYKIQYQINSIDGQWVEIANNGTITGLANGDTVYARLWNGKTGGDYTSADIICTHSYTNGTCTICGITCEHDYGSWEIVKEATCEETGAQQRVCSICNNRETQTIEATGHYYTAATCTTLATCMKCSGTTGELLPHNYSAATCTKLATCTECGATTGELLPHQYSGTTCIVCGAELPKINAGVVAKENSIYKITEDGKEKTVLIPEGFAVSGITDEQSIKDGLVIYNLPLNADTTSATFWTADSDSDTYPDVQENYNQFVWVPVEEAYVTAAEITSIINANSFTDETGLTARQKAINYLVSQGRYPMAVQLDNGKNYRGILYNFAAGTDGGVAITSLSDFNILAEESYDWNITGFKDEWNREPGTVSYEYGLDGSGAALETNPNTIELTQAKLQAEYDSMVKSVNENGGFYVARYELIQERTTGALSFGSKRGQTVASAAAESANTWYGLYDVCQKLYNNDSLPVQSTMISGAQWDQIMIWMKDVTNTYTNSEGTTVNTYYVIDSTNMGNYSAETGGTGAIQVSGLLNNYSVKKIFDLGGNLSDWTSEARDYVSCNSNSSGRVLRGNCYTDSASSNPASSRGFISPTFTLTSYTARSTLYIK